MRKSDFAFWTFMAMTGLAGATTVLNVAGQPNSFVVPYSTNNAPAMMRRMLRNWGAHVTQRRAKLPSRASMRMLLVS